VKIECYLKAGVSDVELQGAGFVFSVVVVDSGWFARNNFQFYEYSDVLGCEVNFKRRRKRQMTYAFFNQTYCFGSYGNAFR